MLESVLRWLGVIRGGGEGSDCHYCRCVGSVLVISLGLQLRWWQIASVCPLVPILALVLSLLVPESPVFRSKSS